MEETTIPVSIESEKVDRISGLPDDVIASILSPLTMKEAGRTSVLSKRWRYMWTCFPRLNFDGSRVLNEILDEKKELDVERPLYLNWVNQVLKSYRGSIIDEFRVKFDLDDSCRVDIDNWVVFAIEKKVKRLELDFSYCWDMSNNYNLDWLSIPVTSFNFLSNLRLARVNICGQLLESFFTHCPFLEEVYVGRSESLVNLKVPRLSHKLKRLEIFKCFNVESIEIYALNIAYFKYFGRKIEFPLKDDQTPIELFIGGPHCEYVIRNFLPISSYLCRLESLTLVLPFQAYPDRFDFDFAKFPTFNKLKQLDLRLGATEDRSLLVFVPLIEACPFLNKFVLQVSWQKFFARRKQKVESRPNWSLKEVELIGFVGRPNDVELSMYLIKRAVMLEKITFDTRNPSDIGCPWEFIETPEKDLARKIAFKLGKKLPAGAELKIV